MKGASSQIRAILHEVIHPNDWTEMPWRNGRGVTSEILAKRHGTSIVWRMSTAIVSSDGAYSSFPGMTRISTVIEGAGTTLRDPDSGAVVDIPPLTPTLLDGNIAWQGTLKEGPLRHFNLIFNSQLVQASINVFYLRGEAPLPDKSVAIFCVAGHCEMAGQKIKRYDMAKPRTGVLSGKATLLIMQIKRI